MEKMAKFKKTRYDMRCRKCCNEFSTANSWHLCLRCYVQYEKDIPDHIPKEQHQKYLVRIIKEIHEI